MTERDLLGPMLDPPSGGLARLRRTVETNKRAPTTRTARWAAAGGLAAGLTLLGLFLWKPGPSPQQQAIRQAVTQAVAGSSNTDFQGAAYVEVPTHRPDVRILLVASLPSSQSAAKPPSDR